MSANSDEKKLKDDKAASRAPFDFLMKHNVGNMTEGQVAELNRLLNAAPSYNAFTDEESQKLKEELEKSGALIIKQLPNK